MYRTTTRHVQITVTPEYSSDRSEPGENEYFWAYTIEILNLGEEAVQLISRHWKITDANGRTEEVKGAGLQSGLMLSRCARGLYWRQMPSLPLA